MSRYVLYIHFFFTWAIISILTTPLFLSPANVPVRNLATSMEKCQTVGKKPNCSFQSRRGGGWGQGEPDCLWWKLTTIPGCNPMGSWGQSSGISYLFFSAHLSPVLNNFSLSLFFPLANTLNKNGTWVVTGVPSSQEVSSLEGEGNHLQDSPSPGCRALW